MVFILDGYSVIGARKGNIVKAFDEAQIVLFSLFYFPLCVRNTFGVNFLYKFHAIDQITIKSSMDLSVTAISK